MTGIGDLKNIKVGVLGGGVSSEREISLISANEALKALRRQAVDAIFIDINTCDKEKVKNLLSCGMDVVFIALHGEFGEDGRIQQILEEMNIAYTGSSPLASSTAMNKIKSKEIFFKEKIPTAHFTVWQEGSPVSPSMGYPVVVKPHLGGSSIGLSIVRNAQDLNPALDKVSALNNKAVLEEFIPGRELTVGILEENPLSVIEIAPKTGYFDFTAKYSDGLAEFIVPAKLADDIRKIVQAVALKAHRALGCRHFSRVDIILDKNNCPYVLEVNSIPGLTTHSLLPLAAKHCGISFDELILKMTLMGLNEKRKKS
jgi:D-alanine-D-alanine ligase